MAGKHNTGGFRVPEEPPAWPAKDLDEEKASIIDRIIGLCHEQYRMTNVFPYFFVFHSGNVRWHAKVSARDEFDERVDLDFSYDGVQMHVINLTRIRSNHFSTGVEFND